MTQLNFRTCSFCECVDLSKRLDRECFPQEMWMEVEELEVLLQSNAQAIVVTMDGKDVGMAILILESHAAQLLEEADGEFKPHPRGMYSYSEAILPEYQSSGLGKALINEMTTLLRRQGFEFLSAHVRAINGWDRGRESSLKIVMRRTLTTFWEDPQETVTFQAAEL